MKIPRIGILELKIQFLNQFCGRDGSAFRGSFARVGESFLGIDDFFFAGMDGRHDVIHFGSGFLRQHFFYGGTDIGVMDVVHQLIEIGDVVVLEQSLVAHQTC